MEAVPRFARWDGTSILLETRFGPSFRVHADGRVEDLDPQENNPDKVAILEGQALGHSLHVRRILALHGSASVGPRGAVAVLGFSGWGKSTMGAHLVARGFGFLTDDVLAIGQLKPPTVLAGPPTRRLWPDAATMLGHDVNAMPLVWEGHSKRRLTVEPVAPKSPLAAIYVLDRDATRVESKPVPPAQAMVELVRHSFAFQLLQERPEEWHFRAVSALASQVPMRTIGVPQGLPHVANAAELIARQEGGDG